MPRYIYQDGYETQVLFDHGPVQPILPHGEPLQVPGPMAVDHLQPVVLERPIVKELEIRRVNAKHCVAHLVKMMNIWEKLINFTEDEAAGENYVRLVRHFSARQATRVTQATNDALVELSIMEKILHVFIISLHIHKPKLEPVAPVHALLGICMILAAFTSDGVACGVLTGSVIGYGIYMLLPFVAHYMALVLLTKILTAVRNIENGIMRGRIDNADSVIFSKWLYSFLVFIAPTCSAPFILYV